MMKHFLYYVIVMWLSVCIVSVARADTITLPLPPSSVNALKAFYNTTGGNNWHHRDNWFVIDEENPYSVCRWRGVFCKNYKVLGDDGITYIHLYVDYLFFGNNNLQGPFPSMLSALPRLRNLVLRENQLSGHLPESIGQFQSLEVLDLSRNQLTGSLPEAIGALNNLRHLNLQLNQFSGPLPLAYFALLERRIDDPFKFSYFSLAGNLELGSPFGDWFIDDFPELAAKYRLFGEGHGQHVFTVNKFGHKSCFLPEKKIAELFQGLGWKADSCSTEDVSCPEGNTGPNCLVGNPMNLRNGVKQQTEIDYQGTGVLPIRVSRTYNSRVKRWQFNQFDAFLYDYRERLKGVTLGNGRSYFFAKGSAGGWSASKAGKDSAAYQGYYLQQLSDGIRFVRPSGDSLDFNDDGQLIRINSIDGHALQVGKVDNIVTITDGFGQSVTITYDEFNLSRPLSITTPQGQLLYHYDEFGHLISVTYPDGKLKQYHYDEAEYTAFKSQGLLTGITDERGVRFATWYYDDLERVYKSIHGDNANVTEIEYLPDDENGRKVRIEHLPSGGSKKYYLDATYGMRAEQIEHLDNQDKLVGTEYFVYSPSGHLRQYTDIKGVVTDYVRFVDGREISRTIAVGTARERKVSTTYVDKTNLPLTVTTPELVTAMTYNERKQVLTRTLTDRYTNQIRTTTYSYNAQGLLATIDGPRTDVEDITTFSYDALGRRIKTTNALGHATEVLAFNAASKPIKIKDANGVITHVTYDSRERVTSITTNNLTTTFKYNGTGQQTQVTLPAGQSIYYRYDNAQRLIAIKDQLGNRINYRLDSAGNRIKTVVKDTQGVLHYTQKQVFDAFSRISKIKSGVGSVEKFKYNAANELIREIDELGHKTKHSYDETGNITITRHVEGGKTRYGYDGVGRVATVKDAEGKTTYYQYNDFGELIKQISPDTGITTYQYDQAGNLLQKHQLGIEHIITYQYDALNRVTYDSAHQGIYTYDQGEYAKGRLTQVIDSIGKEQLFYDSNGNTIKVLVDIDGVQLSTEYHYDDKNRLVAMTYPSGSKIDFTLNSLEQVVAVHRGEQVLVEAVEYLPFGAVKGLTYGNGLTLKKTFDLAYRLHTQTTIGIEDKTFGYSLRSNITSIDDLFGNSQSYSYSPMARLTEVEGLSFSYDKIGNRQSKNDQVYTYAEKSHQLLNTGNTAYQFDGAGRAIKKADITFDYNDAGLIATISKGEQAVSYHYNHRNQRVMKTGPIGTTIYIYDLSGKLIAEADQQGNVIVEYVYLHDRLIAKTENRETSKQVNESKIYFVHNNHIDTPTKLTNINGAVVWQANYSPFGLGDINQDVDADGQAVTLNIRFPGQYYDVETGLHYNWHRYYDPQIGRYLQSDPIGLLGGINTYAYVGGNPVMYFDPQGLKAWINVFPNNQGGFNFIAHDDQGSSLIVGNFNNNTTNFNQIRSGTYNVTPRPILPNTFSNWLFDRNSNAGNPTISNSNDWNTIEYSNGDITKGAQFHEGRNGTSSGVSQACMVSDRSTNDALNELFQLNYDKGGVMLIVYPQGFQGL